MKHSKEDRLLQDLLGDSGPANLRHDSLELGLAALRRRRQVRSACRVVLGVGLPLAMVVGFFLRPAFTPAQPPPYRAASTSAAAVTVPRVAPPPVQIITEAELLALFPDRTVALIGKPGQQRLLVFDKPAARGFHPPRRGWQ